MKILVVDDHQLVIDGIKSMMQGSEYDIIAEATSSLRAWELILANPNLYDLVIADISMKGESGLALCRRIKESFTHIKVLILSMHTEEEYIQEAIISDADGYILKNNGQGEFLEALNCIEEKGYYYSHNIISIVKTMEKKHSDAYPRLTRREMEVLDLILKEFTSRQIADKLFISKQTVNTHRINLMSKTSSKSIVGLIKYAVRNNLL